MSKLSIIIVHYKTFELTQRCIQSIFESTKNVDFEIIVVDNNSNDGAGEKITSTFPSVKWIYNSNNDGFGRANNIGAKEAKGNYLLFMNSDMLIPENTINKCLDYMLAHTNIGVLGPKLLNEDGSFQKSTYHYVGNQQELLKDNLLLDKLYSFKTPALKAVMGSFMIIPKNVFEQVNGFDPDFFMYCEELDLCERITEKRYEICYFEEVHAIHKHGGSATTSNWVLKQIYLSRSLLVFKRKGIWSYIISHHIHLFNFITNFCLMWLLDKKYRKGFWITSRCYFSNWLIYWSIPFNFTRKLGTTKRNPLKSA